MLVVFCGNLLEIGLFFVVDRSKLTLFVGQILNSRIIFILERREYILSNGITCSEQAKRQQQAGNSGEFARSSSHEPSSD